MTTERGHGQEGQGNDHPQTGPDVIVTINGTEKTIHRGSYTVAELKNVLGVSADLALTEDIDGTLTPLPDDKRVTVKGGEAFFWGARTGGSSHA